MQSSNLQLGKHVTILTVDGIVCDAPEYHSYGHGVVHEIWAGFC